MLQSGDPPRILIVGAGPTGLGAAYRLHELGHANFLVLEKNDYPGGLAASFVDAQGFTWDIGGHIQYSRYEYFDGVMDRALGDAWLRYHRQAYIWILGRFIPYPFQKHLRHLPKDQLSRCVRGLLHAVRDGGRHPAHFREWILCAFGEGIADLFLCPYNFKMWAHPLESLSWQWSREYVATVDVERVLDNVIYEQDEPAWGPNQTFRFPLRGGTGAIWRAVAGLIPSARICFSTETVQIDTERRVVHTAAGQILPYDALISTVPLDMFARFARRDDWAQLASRLKFATTHVIGIGLRGGAPEHLRTTNWMYFPESDCPFYRVTVFSSYSPANVPVPGEFWSLMAEVSESPHKPVSKARLLEETLRGLGNAGLLPGDAQVVSTWLYTADHGYPVPSTDRDEILNELLPRLEQEAVYSRGRFGAWKYEVSSQDHSFMQGVEVVNRVLLGIPELTWRFPTVVNSGGAGRA